METLPNRKLIRLFDKRPDGLVYSSDGENIALQIGIDPNLEAVADTLALNEDLADEADSEDARSEAEQIITGRKILSDVVRLQIEEIKGLDQI